MNIDHDALVKALSAALNEHRGAFICPVDPARRIQDHEWVLLQREKERERVEFWRSMKLHAAKWGMVSLLTFLGYALWLAVKQALLR